MVGASHDRVDKETTTIQVVVLPTVTKQFYHINGSWFSILTAEFSIFHKMTAEPIPDYPRTP
jgi:hypothetical protein